MPPKVKRALTWPLRRIVDPRFADVNRRLADTRAALASDVNSMRGQVSALSGEVAAYSVITTESFTYAGMELRNLLASFDEALEETARIKDKLTEAYVQLADEITQTRSLLTAQMNETFERSLEHLQGLTDAAVRDRLDHVASGDLADLDGVVANLLNHLEGHAGPAAQAGVWFNPPVSATYGAGTARIGGVNERIVELPYAMSALGRLEPPARVLDIGSAESWFPLAAASLGYDVTALDPRPLPYTHPNLTSAAAPFEEWERDQSGTFDAIFLISTIEHIGIGAYGEPIGEPDADVNVVRRLREMLAPGGFLVLTTPYGERGVNELERTYDDEALEALLDGWEILDRREAFRQDDVTWTVDPPGSNGVVMVVATPATDSNAHTA